ncbi:unnamed protein product, partial [Ectocarpus sp. 12 AP-2014]
MGKDALSAGAQAQEIIMHRRTLEAARTSVTAFIGPAEQGPADEAIEIASYAEFSKVYGEISDKFPLSHAVHQFFENGGETAIIVRV